MIRILQVVSVMDAGGMENYIMNLYRHMDREQIQFDFLVHHARKGVYEDEICALGGHVYHTALMDNGNLPLYQSQLRQLFKDHPEYKIVHGHLGSTAYWYLGEAKRNGVPWRILHSHCPARLHTLKADIKHILFYLSPIHANINLACSQQAGEYQFKRRPFEVVPNGIDIQRFRYSQEKREQIRKEYGIQGRFVLGHVGRFNYQKNHPYLLKILKETKNYIPDACLLLVGVGSGMEAIRRLTCEMGLEDSVFFAGFQRDTAPFYQAMDAFVLPSYCEGLPLVGIEAQCAGLPCLFSEITAQEVLLSNQSHFLPIKEENLALWVEEIKKIKDAAPVREPIPDKAWYYDAETVAKAMSDRYHSLVGNCP